MKRFKLAKSSADIVSHAGLALVGWGAPFIITHRWQARWIAV